MTIEWEHGRVAPLNSSQRYQQLYKMLLEAIPSSVLLVNRDLRIVSANRNFLQKMRCSLDNIVGSSIAEVLPSIILDQVNITSQIRRVFDEKAGIHGERLTYRAPGIPLRIYYYSILPFSWRGVVEKAMLLMDDVTEKVRLSEEVRCVERHLASVVESASDIVVSTDLNGSILTWNTAAEKLSGFKFYQVKGRTFYELCAADHQEDIASVFSNLQTGKEMLTGEWSLSTSEAGWIQVSWVCSPMRDHTGQTTGMVAVGRDLTERRKQEGQLLQLQKLAALGVMAGGIAHEIRNPLTICVSAAQFIQEEDVTAEFRRLCANKILEGVQRASVIIEDLLRFARPAASRMDPREIDLLSLLEGTMALIANQAKIQKVELIRRLPDYPVLIDGVETLLQQAFLNLYLNAIHAMPDGGSIMSCVEVVGAGIRVLITDTGHGIPMEHVDKIFDPFYTRWPAGQGMGLGLSICYSIIQQHSGSIEVVNNDGQGCTFIVLLPAV